MAQPPRDIPAVLPPPPATVPASPPPPRLEYGRIDTQHGVFVEHLPDGGVIVTIPPRGAGIFRPLYEWFRIPIKPRTIITVTRTDVRLFDRMRQMNTENLAEERWPRADVAVLRANRYGPGIYVRITGRADFDLLPELNRKLVRFVGQTLDAAMARTARRVVGAVRGSRR